MITKFIIGLFAVLSSIIAIDLLVRVKYWFNPVRSDAIAVNINRKPDKAIIRLSCGRRYIRLMAYKGEGNTYQFAFTSDMIDSYIICSHGLFERDYRTFVDYLCTVVQEQNPDIVICEIILPQ